MGIRFHPATLRQRFYRILVPFEAAPGQNYGAESGGEIIFVLHGIKLRCEIYIKIGATCFRFPSINSLISMPILADERKLVCGLS